jgi:hypothetical protein
MSKYNPPYK